MSESLTTRASLLVRLRDARDGQSWSEFVELYGPFVYRLARSSGFQDADAADLVQDVMRAVAAKMPQFAYDPQRGDFRAWLFTLARRAMIRTAERLARQTQGAGDTEAQIRLANFPASEERRWEREYEQYLLDRSAEQVRGEFEPGTWQAFWRTAIQGQKPADVARELNLTIVAVYNAKCRVLTRLRQAIKEIRCD